MLRKLFAILACAALLMSACVTGVFADEAKTVVEGARWFPCEAGRENDILWEVQFGDGENRGFDLGSEGDENYLSTTYGEDGSLTLKRTGSDGKGDVYWPNCRTLYLENYPELDWKTANTLYFDFEAVDCQWNLQLGINGMTVKFSKVISDACGVSGVADSNADGVAGTYKGSINLQDALTEIAAESGTESAPFAMAINNMNITYVPQVTIFYVGSTAGSLKINSLFMSSADDTEGAKCDYVDMGLIMGDDYYTEGPAEDNTDADNGDTAPTDTAEDGSDEEPDVTTTKAAEKEDDKGGDDAGVPTVVIVVIAVAAVIIIAAVAVIIVKKKHA